MTIQDDFDELASAYLDGEATADEIARVEADPELMAHVEEFRLIANAVAAPVILPAEATRQAAVAAAIEASGITFTSAGPVTAPVASLDAARAKRERRNSRLLSIAATFVAVAVGGAIIWSVANSGSDEVATSTAADSASDAVDDAGAAMVESAEAMSDDVVDDAAMDDSEDAMEDDAMEEEEAMEEAAADVAPAAAADETRLGDDDDEATAPSVDQTADDGSAEESADAGDADATAQALTLPEFYARQAGELADTDQTDQDTGLFAVPLEERVDYLGTFDTTEELSAAAAELTAPVIEPSPLNATDCPSVVGRLALAEASTALGTAHLVDPVTGQATELALLTVTVDGTDALIAIGLEDCRLFIGQDDLP